MNTAVQRCIASAILLFIQACSAPSLIDIEGENDRPPNIVVIFADDLGYGDISSYGASAQTTPRIDSIGRDGYTSRDFFVPSNVCSPSRAALLTGRYPMRNGMPVARHPLSKKHNDAEFGLHEDELTLPEILAPAGYRSLAVGKWHLGFTAGRSHPLDAGFDEYVGVRGNYYRPTQGDPRFGHLQESDTLYKGRAVAHEDIDLEQLTEIYTNEVIAFMKKEQNRPFFVYFAHNIAHSPHRPREAFVGTSENGPYGDFIQELDHSTGRVLDALKDLGLEENTIVVFTSDNGANFQGDNGELSGGKYTTMEGGHIVPAMMRWPGVIPEGLDSDISITSMDLFPLFADIAGVELPKDRTIDGKNIVNVLSGESQASPHDVLYYYNGINLQAIRKGRWKLHLPRTVNDQPFWHKNSAGTRIHTKVDDMLLFDVKADPGESRNLASQYPEVVDSFLVDIAQARAELGDVDVIGSDQRILPFDDVQEIDRWWSK